MPLKKMNNIKNGLKDNDYKSFNKAVESPSNTTTKISLSYLYGELIKYDKLLRKFITDDNNFINFIIVKMITKILSFKKRDSLNAKKEAEYQQKKKSKHLQHIRSLKSENYADLTIKHLCETKKYKRCKEKVD